jgi:hypothetical protein
VVPALAQRAARRGGRRRRRAGFEVGGRRRAAGLLHVRRDAWHGGRLAIGRAAGCKLH